MLVGSLTHGYLADRFGRRPLLLTIFITGPFLLIAALVPSLVVYAMCMFGAGMTSISFYLAALVLVQEICDEKNRAIFGIMPHIFFSVGYMTMPLGWFLIQHWKWFMLLMSSFCVLFVPSYWLIPESPLWLENKRKQLIAEEKKPKFSELLPNTQNANNPTLNQNTTQKLTFIDILKSSVLVKNTLNLILQWTSTLLTQITLSLNTSNISSNIYLSSFMSAMLEIPALFLAILLTRRFRRLKSFIFTLFMTFAACLVVPFVDRASEIGGLVCALAGKFFATASISMLYALTGDIYPTPLRSIGLGVVCAMSRLFTSVSPFLILAGETVNKYIPYYVVSALSFLSFLLSFKLPETDGMKLPETLDDAAALKPFLSFRRNSIKV